MQDSLSGILEYLDIQIECLRKLEGIEAEQKALVEQGNIDGVLKLLERKSVLLQKYASVNGSIDAMLSSLGFTDLKEVLDSIDLDSEKESFVSRFTEMKERIRSIIEKEDEAIDMLKTNLSSVKGELENLSAGRKIIESYYKIPKGLEPRFFDKKR